ncbi:hypothetical protein GBAR_LOCUS5962 [Geodia barretti]|uniref:Uncharacterized protein n=1 Tax=Geodia barretti TaxID=519541 RepID=A0AA35RC56_GEOBA|nr:hypothetical protein GBAR_LOCUS5962 [Geodia barretti]
MRHGIDCTLSLNITQNILLFVLHEGQNFPTVRLTHNQHGIVAPLVPLQVRRLKYQTVCGVDYNDGLGELVLAMPGNHLGEFLRRAPVCVRPRGLPGLPRRLPPEPSSGLG